MTKKLYPNASVQRLYRGAAVCHDEELAMIYITPYAISVVHDTIRRRTKTAKTFLVRSSTPNSNKLILFAGTRIEREALVGLGT